MKKSFGRLGGRFAIVAILTLSALVVIFAVAPNNQALAANPTTINFQGKVVNATTFTNQTSCTTTCSIVFRIYNTASPVTTTTCTTTASCLWEETQTSLTVTNGIFQVNLGAVCALTSASCNNTASGGIPANWSGNSLFLTMQFNGDAAGFMSPTIKIQSVPFAFNADNLGGLGASNFVQLAQGVQTDTSTTNPSIFVNKNNGSGTPNILELQKAGNDVLVVNNSGTLLLGKAGTGGLNGSLVFNTINASNTAVTISAASTGTSYSLTLPTTGPGTSQCLKTDVSTASLLTFASCTGTLASTYNSATTTGNTIALATAGGGIFIQDAASTVGSIFTVQNNGGTSNYFNVTSSAITIEDSGATHRMAVSIDITNHILKVFSPDGTTNYASISATNTDATFKSNVGNTIIGSGSGTVTINAGAGSAVNITGHAASTWQTDTGGSLTIQGGSTLSLLSTTSSTISLDSGSTGNLNIGTGANAKPIAVGNSQSGTTVTTTAGAVVQTLSNTGALIKTNTNSVTAFQIQNNTSTSNLLIADTINSKVGFGVQPASGGATLQLLGNQSISNGTINAALQVTQTGNTSASVVTGGAINLDNTSNTGAGVVVYSNQVAPAGRLFVINAANASFSQDALRIQQNGTGSGQSISVTNVAAAGAGAAGLTIADDAGGGSASVHGISVNLTGTGNANASAANFVSSNAAASAVQISGSETGRGSLKITHTGTGSDINAAAISIDLQGTGTAAQGIYIDATGGGTTGNLVNLKNNGTQVAYIDSSGIATFNPSSPSTAAFQIQDSGVNLFTANTSTGNIQIGSSTTNATANLFVLDSYNSGADPTGVTGATYYNTSLGAFRCYTTAWTNCAGAGSGGDLQAAYVASTSPATITTTSSTKNLVVKAGATFDSTGLFQVQNSGGGSLLNVDSAFSNITLLGNNSGDLPAWSTNTTNPLPLTRKEAATVYANGYVYVMGGWDTSSAYQNSVYYAKVNADGSIGSWTLLTGTPLPQPLRDEKAAYANGYIYVTGGATTGNAVQSTTYYVKTNADGTLGTWQNGSALPAVLWKHSMLAVNGYLYVIGGNNGTTDQATTSYMKLNADGSMATATWNVGGVLPAGRADLTTAYSNGYIYEIGGSNSTGVSTSSINPITGANAAFTATGSTQLTTGIKTSSSVIANGYIYLIGGFVSGNEVTAVQYASIGPGTIGAMNNATNGLPVKEEQAGAFVANGYIYLIGGYDGTAADTTIYYTSTSRVKIGGNLDLVGLSGENLADPSGSGGSLTAGNGTFTGTLNVQDQATFGGSLSVGKELNVNGTAQFTNASVLATADGVNGVGVNFATSGTTASVDNSGLRIDVTSNNSGATTTLEGLNIGNLTTPEANSTETGVYVGTGWDVGLDLESGGIQMAALSANPAAPASGLLRVYAKTVAGRTVLKTIGSAGLDTPLQNALWQNNTVIWTPGVAAGTWQGATGGAVGTPAVVQPTTTNLYTSERKSTYTAATAAANIQNGIRSDAQFFHGNVAGNGGFFAAFHFGTTTWTAGDRLFVGFGVCTTACTTVNPSSLLNIAGFGIDAGDTAITFMHNDGSGTATKDTIAGQPTLASNQGYDAYIYMKPNDSTIYYRLDNTNTSTTIVDTSITTDIIAVNTMVIAHAEMGTGTNITTTSSVIGINRIYVETDH